MRERERESERVRANCREVEEVAWLWCGPREPTEESDVSALGSCLEPAGSSPFASRLACAFLRPVLLLQPPDGFRRRPADDVALAEKRKTKTSLRAAAPLSGAQHHPSRSKSLKFAVLTRSLWRTLSHRPPSLSATPPANVNTRKIKHAAKKTMKPRSRHHFDVDDPSVSKTTSLGDTNDRKETPIGRMKPY